MRKKILSIFLAACLIFSLMPVSAMADTTASGTCGDNLTWTLENGTLTISGTGEMTDFSTSLNPDGSGTMITSAPWGEYYETIKSVVIENGVTNIGGYAFYKCSSVTSITMPNSVTSIGKFAFRGCSNLKSVTIGNGVTVIGDRAFDDCRKIENVYYNGDIKSWLGIEFKFANSNPCYYGSDLYFDGKLATDIVIPDGVTSVGYSAFYGCSSLTSVTIPDGVTNIGLYAFKDCDGLTSVTIADSVTSIDVSAFYGCSSLTSVTLGSGVTSIGGNAFEDCNKIKNVYYNGDIQSWLGISLGGYYSTPCNGSNLYFNGKLVTDVVIPKSITSIGGHAFYGCSSITSVVIPDSVTSIGENAFHDCTGLTSVTIPDSVTSIGEYAFYNCSSLTSVAIPGSVASIEKYAFYDCESLTNVTIGNGVTSIGDYAFRYCSSLTSMTIPDSVTSIGTEAFYWCSSLRDVAFSGTKKAWSLIGCNLSSVSSSVRMHYNCATLDGHYVLAEKVEPTCTTKGYAKYSCACGYEYTETLTLEHNYIDTVIQPSCTSDGYTLHKCQYCGNSYKDNYTSELGHDYKNGSCTRCGEKDPNYVAAPVIKTTTSAGKPKISWSKVDGAAKYKVYYSTDGKKYYQLIETTKTSVTHTGAKIGTTYYYKVKAVNSNGAESVYSNTKSIKCVPAAPTVTISRVSGKAKLSWKAVSGATKYWIYRSTDGKTYKQYTSTTKLTYTDSKSKSGTKYYYKVRAIAVVNNTNVGSAYSTAKSFMTTMAKPTVKITTTNGKPKLSWSKVTGADRYYIYRSTDGKNFKYYTTTTKLSYTNTGAKKGTKYYYKVKAICSSNTAANSALSTAVSIKATK